MRGWTRGFRFGALVGAVALLLSFTPIGAFIEEQLGLVWLFKLRGTIQPPDDVIIVSLDRQSAAGLRIPPSKGEWPREWPRSLHAKLVDELTSRGAATIVFDVRFERAQTIEEDQAFASAIAKAGRVVLVEHLERSRRQMLGLSIEEWRRPLPLFAEAALGAAPFPVPAVPSRVSQFWAFYSDTGHTPTLPAVALQAHVLERYDAWLRLLEQAGLGLIVGNTLVSAYGPPEAWKLKELTRAFRSVLIQDPRLGRSLSQALATEHLSPLSPSQTPRERMFLNALVRLYSGPDSYHLNFYGPPGTIRTIAYDTIFAAGDAGVEKLGADLTGAAVFIGYSELNSPSTDDDYDTVFSREDGVKLSGVEIAATAFANLLTGSYLHPADLPTKSLILLVLGCILGGCAFLLPASRAVPAVLLLLSSYTIGALVLFTRAGVWLPVAVPALVVLPLVLFTGLFDQYSRARRQRKDIWQAIRYYVPENVAQKLADHPLDPISVREPAFATCLATDAENYTALSEHLNPDQTAAFLNSYFAALAEPLQRHEAHFREFHADSVLCAWISQRPDVALRKKACLAALEALEAIDEFNARVAPLHLGVRIGLHAGKIFVGNIGAGGRFAFRLVGDIVNTASRLQSLNKKLGTRLLATEVIVDGVDGLLLRPLGRFCLEGKQNAPSVVEIASTLERASEAQISLFAEFARALQAYHGQQWHRAVEDFSAIVEQYPNDGPSQFYLAHCRSSSTAVWSAGDPMAIRIGSK